MARPTPPRADPRTGIPQDGRLVDTGWVRGSARSDGTRPPLAAATGGRRGAGRVGRRRRPGLPGPLGGLARRLTAFEQRVVDRVAAAESPHLDRTLPRLGAASDRGRLWLGIAAVLALTGHARCRRAAARGVASLAVAATAANVLAKGLAGRVGPVVDRVPPQRRLSREPVTSSFPSGHAASAAAFATGVAMELPLLAVPVGALAAGVIASRVVTGVHYPSDVLAGAALGVAAAALTRRFIRP